jgi:hypothetical protein
MGSMFNMCGSALVGGEVTAWGCATDGGSREQSRHSRRGIVGTLGVASQAL